MRNYAENNADIYVNGIPLKLVYNNRNVDLKNCDSMFAKFVFFLG